MAVWASGRVGCLDGFFSTIMAQPQRTPGSGIWLVLGFAWRLGYSIAIPLVVLLLGGRLLDRRLGPHPWFLLGGLGLSFVITTALLFVESLRVMREAQETEEKPGQPSATQPDTPKEDSYQ